jgi:hypothetical protein
MAYLILIVLFAIATAIRTGLGGQPFGLGFWITAVVFLFIINPIVFSMMKGSRFDSEEMKFHRKFVSEDVPVLLKTLAEFKEKGVLPGEGFVLTAAPRDRSYLNRIKVLDELEDLEKLVHAARRDQRHTPNPR